MTSTSAATPALGARRVPAHARDAAGAEFGAPRWRSLARRPGNSGCPLGRRGHPRHPLVVLAAAPEPPGGLAKSLCDALGFFRARVDMVLEDDDEAAISRVVAPGADGANALWAVELDLFLREPTSPLNKKEARALERVSLTFECEFAPRDEGVYPSRGAAGARNSRFFANDAVGAPGTFWIADEPGYFKFTIPAAAPVVASGIECVPAGDVFFNGKIRTDNARRRDGDGDGDGGDGGDGGETGTTGTTRLASGVATVKRNVPASFMGANYDGILAEYIIVGTFTAMRRN